MSYGSGTPLPVAQGARPGGRLRRGEAAYSRQCAGERGELLERLVHDVRIIPAPSLAQEVSVPDARARGLGWAAVRADSDRRSPRDGREPETIPVVEGVVGGARISGWKDRGGLEVSVLHREGGLSGAGINPFLPDPTASIRSSICLENTGADLPCSGCFAGARSLFVATWAPRGLRRAGASWSATAVRRRPSLSSSAVEGEVRYSRTRMSPF